MTRWCTTRIRLAVAAAVVMAIPAIGNGETSDGQALHAAQTMFYNGRFAEAAAATSERCTAAAMDLAGCEVRTSALLFQMRRAIGEPQDKEKAWAECAACPGLLAIFVAETRQAQVVARTYLKSHPDDVETLFYLGKLDLNYVWLHLGTLGKKTGWDEYWEARRSLDQVLKTNPHHVRAKIARAWIDYIVDTKMPRMTKWLLGGGSKKRGLQAIREAAGADAEFFAKAEADFALWDMQVRERNIAGALDTARRLAGDFPENAELRKFVSTHSPAVSRVESPSRPAN